MASPVIKRLTRELRELCRDPLPGTNAAPLENNMLEWHCTTLGPEDSPYEKVPFHWILEFPDNYPASPPKAFFPIKFGRGKKFSAMSTDNKGRQIICMNLFSNFETSHPEWKRTVGEGWSPSFTVSTVLIQVQAALADGEFISHQASDVKATLRDATKYSCHQCRHKGAEPKSWFPEISPWKKQKKEAEKEKKEAEKEKKKAEKEKKEAEKEKKKEKKKKEKNPNKGFEISEPSFEETEKDESKKDEPKKDESKQDKPKKFEPKKDEPPKFEPFCYATRQNLSDDQPILGFGLTLGYEGGTGDLDSITSPYEFISLDAYNEGHRRTSLKREFQQWIPLYINAEHWKRAKPEFEQRIIQQLSASNPSPKQKWERRDAILEYFSIMMRSLFDNCQNRINEHFINGYFAIYRTFLAYEMEFKDYANQQVNLLIESNLLQVPAPDYSIDYWMILIFLSRYEWEEIAEAMLNEMEIRHLKDYLNQNPEFYKICDLNPAQRAIIAFRTYRLFLLRVAFYVAFYQGIRGLVFSDLDFNNGMLNENTKMILQIIGQEVSNMNSWQDFYRWIGLKWSEKKDVPDNYEKGQNLMKGMLLAEKLEYFKPQYQIQFTCFNLNFQPVTNCPERNQIYHRCSKHCLDRYGSELERRSPLRTESGQGSGALEKIINAEREKTHRAWLRQSH